MCLMKFSGRDVMYENEPLPASESLACLLLFRRYQTELDKLRRLVDGII